MDGGGKSEGREATEDQENDHLEIDVKKKKEYSRKSLGVGPIDLATGGEFNPTKEGH